MKIYRPAGLTRTQVAFVTVVGVFAGVYIWKPLIEEHFKRGKKPESNKSYDQLDESR